MDRHLFGEYLDTPRSPEYDIKSLRDIDRTVDEYITPFGPGLLRTFVDEKLCDQVIDWVDAQEDAENFSFYRASTNLAGQLGVEYKLPEDTFADLIKTIESKTWAYLRQSKEHFRGCEHKPDVKVKTIWANKQGKGEWNPPHTHSFQISGVLHLNTWDIEGRHPHKSKVGCTSFLDGRDMDFTNSIRSFLPIKGQLIIFPAWLTHYVESNFKDEFRYTLSFNI